MDVVDFHNFIARSYLILSDSGGVQEEAPSLGVPVLVLRDTTERPEALDAGTVKLVGTDYNKIVSEVSKLLDDKKCYTKMREITEQEQVRRDKLKKYKELGLVSNQGHSPLW